MHRLCVDVKVWLVVFYSPKSTASFLVVFFSDISYNDAVNMQHLRTGKNAYRGWHCLLLYSSVVVKPQRQRPGMLSKVVTFWL